MSNSKKLLNLEEAARHLGCEAKFIKNSATSGELPYMDRGSQMMFELHHLNDWYSNLILHQTNGKQISQPEIELIQFCSEAGICLELEGKTKTAILKSLTDLCERTGLLYNPGDFFEEIKAREDISSTAMPNGVALVHPENHDEFLCESTFVVIGRSTQPVFFGEADGIPTDIFFVVASPDANTHLKLLAKICQLLNHQEFLEILRNTDDPSEIISAIQQFSNK